MLVRVKYCFRAVLSLIVIISLQSALLAAPGAAVKWSDLDNHLAEKSVVIESMPVIDCPVGMDCDSAEHLVCQVIENTFYKWKEYEFFTAAGETRLALEMIKPEARFLTAAEAQVLLNGSKLWERQSLEPLTDLTMRPSPIFHPKTKYPVAGAPRTSSGVMPLEVSVDNLGDVNQEFVPRASIVVDVDHESATRESVHGTDGRKRVTSISTITNYPWNTICYLDFTSGGDSYRGSGILIASNCVLTCGHNVWDQDLNDWSDDVLVTPAQYQAYQGASIYEPYGTIADTTLASNSIYADPNNRAGFEYDYGVVKLRQSFSGISTFMPLEYDATPTFVNIAGYPGAVQGESNSYDMWHEADDVSGYEGVNDRIMLHQVDTSAGQSGSPVWKYSKNANTRRLVAIHVFGATRGNGACRLVSAIEGIVSGWMEYEPVAPSYSHFSYVPYFSTSSSRWTGLALANHNDRSNSIKVDYYAANSSHLGSERKSIAAYGQEVFATATANGSEGWIKVSSTSPLKGLVLIGDSAPAATMFDIDLKNTLHRRFLFPHLAADQSWRSFVMICNPSNAVARIGCSYYNGAGVLVSHKTVPPVSVNGSAVHAVSTLFQQSLTGGSMILESDQPITAFLLYDNKTTAWKAGLSAVPLD